jgi:hypothetical protein
VDRRLNLRSLRSAAFSGAGRVFARAVPAPSALERLGRPPVVGRSPCVVTLGGVSMAPCGFRVTEALE